MPNTCSICTRNDRNEIDAAIIERSASLRNVAERFRTTPQTLLRHREHIPKSLAKAVDAKETANATTLLGKVTSLENDARRIGKAAEVGGDLRTALAAITQLVRICELLGRITGELAAQGNMQVNVLANGGVALALRLAAQNGLSEADVARLVKEEIEWRALPEEQRKLLIEGNA